jgi:folate-binding protein YgfZ
MLKDSIELGAVRVRGSDAVGFLQGQLSNDVAQLAGGQPMLAGLHNPQGRAIALLRLVLVGADDVFAVLPRELAASVATRLSKYVLRAKVKVTDASAELESSSALSQLSPEDFSRTARIAAGLPQVYAPTSEQFVAQMLNLDVLNGISFTKGCYTGQEVIARAHYRGRVKRRMQRFRTMGAAELALGAVGKLRDGRSFRVVDAIALAEGSCEFLAVAPMDARSDDAPASDSTDSGVALDVEQLPLPYALPD